MVTYNLKVHTVSNETIHIKAESEINDIYAYCEYLTKTPYQAFYNDRNSGAMINMANVCCVEIKKGDTYD